MMPFWYPSLHDHIKEQRSHFAVIVVRRGLLLTNDIICFQLVVKPFISFDSFVRSVARSNRSVCSLHCFSLLRASIINVSLFVFRKARVALYVTFHELQLEVVHVRHHENPLEFLHRKIGALVIFISIDIHIWKCLGT